MSVWIEPPATFVDLWWNRTSALVLESLVRDQSGKLRIVPTPGLLSAAAANPGLEYAAIEQPSGSVADGSSRDLVADLTSSDGLRIVGAIFQVSRPRGTFPRAEMECGAYTFDVPIGKTTVLVCGGQVRFDDQVNYWSQIGVAIARYALPAFALLAATVFWVTRQATASLRIAGVEASAMDFRKPSVRLPEDNRVPSEIMPLVRGINLAFNRLEEDFRRQQRFTANAAHEMRTPLAILRARIDGLPGIAEQAALRRDAQRIATLIDQMLAVARLEHNQANFELFNLTELAADLVGEFAPLAADAGRSVAFAPPEHVVRLRANRAAVESALANLIDNALREEPPDGTVVIAIDVAATITVTDHGRGIAPSERELIFEPFWRRDESRAGSGLGLAIVHEIARLHGGSVSVVETPGGGATFRLVLRPPTA